MTCPKCGAKPKSIKTEEATEGHARLLECDKHGRFWSLERLWKWVVKLAGNGSTTAGQPLGNGPPTAIPVAEPLGNLQEGSDSDLTSGSDSDLNPNSPENPKRARARGIAKDYPAEFERLWEGCIPHTGNKHPAFEQWLKLKPDTEIIIGVYLEWVKTDNWQRGYIPHLRKWLRARGWETLPTPADMAPARNGAAVVSFAVRQEQERQRAQAEREEEAIFGRSQ